jgi:hypothetical protein
MPQEFSAGVLTFALIGAVLLHVALVVSVLFYRKVNPLYLLAGAFFALSLTSAIPTLPNPYVVKWARAYITILMIVIGLFGYRFFRFGLASKLFLACTGFYVFAAVWSDMPISGLMFKSLHGMTAIAGVFLAYSARDHDELTRGIRFIGTVAGFVGLTIILVILDNPDALTQARLKAWEIGANRINLLAMPLLVVCGYLALYDPSKFWKGLGYVVGIIFALIILNTGSRAAAASTAVGCFVVVLPLIKRPIQATFVASVVVLCAWLAVEHVQTRGALRLLEFVEASHSTAEVTRSRLPIWKEGWKIFQRSPLAGEGWVHSTRAHGYQSTRNLHSIYIQTLAETGFLGLILLGLCFGVSIFLGVRMLTSVRPHAPVPHFVALALGLLATLMLHGIGASSVRTQGLSITLFLGFCIGLIDHLPQLARRENNYASGTLMYRLVPRLPRRGTAGPEITT